MAFFLKRFEDFEKWLNYLAVITSVLMMLLVTYNVAARYIFNSPIESTLELTEFFMVAVVYLGLSYTQAIKGHINIELAVSRLSPGKRAICDLITWTVCFIFFVLLTINGTRMLIESYEIREITMGTTELPVYPAKFFVPFGSLIICIRFLIDVGKSFLDLMEIKN